MGMHLKFFSLCFLALLVKSQISNEEKELICLMLAAGKARTRAEEIKTYHKEHQELSEILLSDKLTDDGFSLCSSQMTDQEADSFNIRKVKNYIEKFSYLFDVPLSKYAKVEDLELSEKYSKVKREFEERLANLKKRKVIEDL